MDLVKIGKFIARLRKDNGLTQKQLAEMMGVSDRAVSKWERGLSLPDASLMIPLCDKLGIKVNELLIGEMINNKENEKKTNELLIDMAKKEVAQNKKLMLYEKVIGYTSSITFIILIFVLSFAVSNNVVRIILFIFAILIFIVGVSFALKIETETGYYECMGCHNKYIPKYKSVYFAPHYGTTRYLKCPNCHKRTWNKKVMYK